MSRPELVSQISTDPFVPYWLDQQELQYLIMQEMPEFGQIENISSRAEHMALRVQVQVKSKRNNLSTVNYLVKSSEAIKNAELKFPLAPNHQMEVQMYEKVLPALVQLYQEVDITIQFTPRNFQHKSKTNSLYLDYMQTKGYRVVNQPQGLGKPAMQAVLSKLAAYHAGTACYLERNPGQIRELLKLSNTETSVKAKELKSLLQVKFHESLRANNLRAYEDKVKSFQKSIRPISDLSDTRTSFNVLLNGACWPNNLLGHADAFGHLKDVLFTDFYLAKYGPAVYDLINLLLTAPAAKSTQFDAYVKYYFDKLTEHLKALKYKRKLPTLTELQLDLLKYGHWAFEATTEILPIVLSDFRNPDVTEMYKHDQYAEQIQELLPWLENRGYFEED